MNSVAAKEIKHALGRDLADAGQDAAAVVDHLATAIEPGLIAMASPRFYGFVIGGTYPAALAADWLGTDATAVERTIGAIRSALAAMRDA